MYAIVRDRSRSLTLHPGQELRIDLLPGLAAGAEIVFDEVALVRKDDGNLVLGTPTVPGARVVATVLGQERGEKVRVFTFKRRKNRRRTLGHRQSWTRIRVAGIQA